MNCQTPRRKDGTLREGNALVTEVLENCALRKIHFRVTHLPMYPSSRTFTKSLLSARLFMLRIHRSRRDKDFSIV